MPGTNKIVKWNLQKTVEELISSGTAKTSVAIAAALTEKGFKISQPTVSRYLKEEKESRKEETKKIVGDHVRATVPADLTALETMESKCLEWAGEENPAMANRLASKHIEEFADEWANLIIKLQGVDRKKAVKEIIAQCLTWTADDIKIQAARITAMRQATSIIEMKLRYAIGEDNDGKIFFLDSEHGDQLVKDDQSGRFMVIPGGQS